MNWKVLLVLLLITLGLGGYLLYQGQPLVENKTDRIELDRVLPYSPEEVRKLTVLFMDTTYVIERDGYEWDMDQPDPGWGADSMVVNHLLRTLSEMPYSRAIPVSELDLAEVGLDNPVLVFTAYRSETDSVRLVFGTLNPATESIYILIENKGEVALANKLLGQMLTVDGFLLRGKSLTGIHPYSTVSVRVVSGTREVFNCSRENSRAPWFIHSGGKKLLADKRALNNILGQLYQAQVREFEPRGQKQIRETGLNSPVKTVTVVSEQGDTAVLKLGANDAELDYIRWAATTLYPEHYVLIDSWLLDEIDRMRPDSMQSRRLANFVPSDVDFISLASPLDSLALRAENDTLWNFVAPQEAKVKYVMLEQLLTHVDTLAADKILPPGGDRGFETPQTRLVLMDGDSLLADVIVGYYADEKVYVRDNVRKLDFLASSRDLEPLNVTFREMADIPVRHVVE